MYRKLRQALGQFVSIDASNGSGYLRLSGCLLEVGRTSVTVSMYSDAGLYKGKVTVPISRVVALWQDYRDDRELQLKASWNDDEDKDLAYVE